MTAPSVGLNPVTGATGRAARARARRRHLSSRRRVRASRRRSGPVRVQLVGNAARSTARRYRASAADSPIVNGQPLWPDDELDATGVAFRDGRERDRSPTPGADGQPQPGLSRAAYHRPRHAGPDRLGLRSGGAGRRRPWRHGRLDGRCRRRVASATPSSRSGRRRSLTYEGGLHYRRSSVRSTLAVFVNEIDDNIAKQSLILPPGAVGTTLGGHADRQPERRTASSSCGRPQPGARARQLRQRAHHRRGAHLRLARRARIGSPARPSRICTRRTPGPGCRRTSRAGTPAPRPTFTRNYTARTAAGGPGPYLHAAAAQGRLSTLDLDDRRTGASRTRASIQELLPERRDRARLGRCWQRQRDRHRRRHPARHR